MEFVWLKKFWYNLLEPLFEDNAACIIIIIMTTQSKEL